ncbi:hypothetical protein BAE44_0026063 [Dichanthelium oligosanthes]|uniref:Uncharacterized protein n=1 Tax=Dichanthelium oligosanthes TaxID=888268 RepID=A0A1E5UJC9_9POAL|nr:hypothetical protein BAE44_0026063 [Dichanthelium oligosanthes]
MKLRISVKIIKKVESSISPSHCNVAASQGEEPADAHRQRPDAGALEADRASGDAGAEKEAARGEGRRDAGSGDEEAQAGVLQGDFQEEAAHGPWRHLVTNDLLALFWSLDFEQLPA